MRQWRIIPAWFVETAVFTRRLDGLIDDDDYRALQIALALWPERGSLIKGGAGLRKLRWARTGSRKRGGIRVIYYWRPADRVFYLLFAYAKGDQSDLTPEQTRTLARIVREELK